MRGHIRRRGKGWCVVVDLGHNEDGRRRQKWHSGFMTRRDAQAALTAILGQVQQGGYIEPTKETVAQFFTAWLAGAGASVRASTLRGYQLLVAAHVLPRLGPVRLQNLSVAQLNALYADLLVSGRRDGKGGLSPASVKLIHAILHKALADAVEWGQLPRNPADHAKPPRPRGRQQLHTWTAQELRAFLESAAAHRFYTIYHLAATTGCRKGEILGLRWEDVDLAAGRLAVTQTLTRTATGLALGPVKTARGRRSVGVLQAHRRQQLEQRMMLGLGAPGPTGRVFANPNGSPVTFAQVARAYDTSVKASGLPRIRFHDLRHTHASLALAAGVHPKVVSERLGHSTVAITLDTYSHVIPALQEDAADTVARAVFGQ